MTQRRRLPDFARYAATRRRLARWLIPVVEIIVYTAGIEAIAVDWLRDLL